MSDERGVKVEKPAEKSGLISDFVHFLKHEKKWWLLPLIVILLVVVLLMILAGSAGPLAPFIYPLV